MCENGGTDRAKYFAWVAQHRVGAGFEPTQSSPWVKAFPPLPTAPSSAARISPSRVVSTQRIYIHTKIRSLGLGLFFPLLKHKWDSATAIV